MDATHQQALLRIARNAIEADLARLPDPPLPEVQFAVPLWSGVFVSLHNGIRLRGCVGRIECSGLHLPDVVRGMAKSVLQDPRFVSHPVTLQEMPQIQIELSILSPMRRTLSPIELEPGIHGVYIRRGINSGCFLPQVATHMHWSAQQMLSRCCADKACLPEDAWRDPATEVLLFTADVFSEPVS